MSIIRLFKIKWLILAAAIFLSFENSYSQVYELMLKPRRAFDQLHVEIWAKSISSSAPKLGYASLVVQYSSTFLKPATVQNPSSTDSIIRIDNSISNPIIPIESRFNNANGYQALGVQSYSNGYYSLEITLDKLGTLGLEPSNSGKGSFLGKLVFDIIGNPSDSSLAQIAWSKSILPGDIRIFDVNGNDIETQVRFVDPDPQYKVVGITIISPNFDGMVVDRDQAYPMLLTDYADSGYPIYFERSFNPALVTAPSTPPPAVDEDVSYLVEYSLDNGTNWVEIGRVTETDRPASSISNNAAYRTGEIFEPKGGAAYTITTQSGAQIKMANYREPLRIIWTKNPNFVERSEQARMRITRLAGNFGNPLNTKSISNQSDINDFRFILGRLFFLQLNGNNQYLRTINSFSNPTQLTVEAWVNLNSYKAAGSEPAIVASSGGPGSTETFGSNEGAWMLYLKDGYLPAFRVREILARGDAPNNIYLGEVTAIQDSIPVASAASPLNQLHSGNWTHLAATVKDNVIALYVNGELVDKFTNNNANDIRMMTTSHPIWIGVNPNDAIDATRFTNAGLKSVRVWRSALTQDEIRGLAGGIVNPTNVATYGDIRRGLEIYYSFEGTLSDLANDQTYQNSSNLVEYVENNVVDNTKANFRPDQPHIKITSPQKGSGITNKINEDFEIRWIAYGLGDIAALGSKDVEIEYSIDNAQTWNLVKNPANQTLGANNAPDVESNRAVWQPYLNNNANANLRTISPYSRTAILKIRGTSANTQNNLYDISKPFTIAPFFGIKMQEGSILKVNGNEAMNISGNSAFFEAWIKPYRFPNDNEGFFPIIEKVDDADGTIHYALRLLQNGQLSFTVTDKNGTERTAISDSTRLIVPPNSVNQDSSWTHVGVLFTRNGSEGKAEVRFYIDGNVHRDNELQQKIGDTIEVNPNNSYPLYIGYNPPSAATAVSFVGEIKEVRLWKGIPNNLSISGEEPTPLTLFVQSALTVNSKDLQAAFKNNLHSAYSFNGGGFIINGMNRSTSISATNNSIVRNFGTDVEFKPVEPFIKLVEPAFRQSIENSNTEARVRWAGNYYDGTGFSTGAPQITPSLEFSIRGGGGNVIQPYQFVGSDFWNGNTKDAMSLPNDDKYRSKGTGSDIYFASALNMSIADPDENNDGVFNDMGPLSASLTNARLRLTGKYTINGETKTIRTEGPLFTITPSSNFTVRVLLEGYHRGSSAGTLLTRLGSSFDKGGLRIQLYKDNGNEIGDKAGSTVESKLGYADRDPVNKNAGNFKFANANFVFTNLTNGRYWVLVEHLNHLPIMSRFPAPFEFTGDISSTWQIESGWDFSSWNGVDNNVLTSATSNPWQGSLYTAKGSAVSTKTNVEYSTTGLIFNGGQIGVANSMAAMVGGDVDRDKQINSYDRVLVRLDDGTSNPRSDITGDNVINGLDRTIVDRNFGKVSSIYNETIPPIINGFGPQWLKDPFNVVAPENPQLSIFFNENAKIRTSIIDNAKVTDKKLVGLNYKVSAEVKNDTNFVDVKFYIQNLGSKFGLANCTFAITYNTNSLDFHSLIGADSVIFSNKPAKGYSALRTAPTSKAENPLPNVRTIEVDYDAYANLGGESVPNEKTYLGTLRFSIKNKKGALQFAWHDSKIVLTTDNRDATQYGIFETIPSILMYKAEMISPNGGEKLSPKRKYKARWNTDGKSDVYLELSTDAGVTWKKLNSDPLAVDVKTFEWTSPDILSDYCLMRIVDAETNTELDRSNSYFSIVANFAQLIRPSTDDAVYSGGASDKIRWSVIGSDRVRFEFSSDAGSNWKPIGSTVMSNLSETAWKIPNVTTKSAVVRMIDADTDVELARSGLFKILNGTLVFKAPKNGEALIANKYYKVRWSSSGVQNFDMQLSTDGGNSWQTEITDVAATVYYKNWLVPEKSSEQAIIRAIWNNDPEMEYGRTEMFKIVVPNSVSQDRTIEGYQIDRIYPNPASSKINIGFKIPEPGFVAAKIFDLNGNKLLEIPEKYFSNIQSEMLIELNNFASGKYILIISYKGHEISGEINILK